MNELPVITPTYAPQPTGVAWPTNEWPRTRHARHGELEAVVEELFRDDTLGVTNAVIVVQGGQVIVERYAGVQEFFDRPPEPVTDESQLLSWSMAKSVLHMIVGTLVDQGVLQPDLRAPVPEWSDSNDPRHPIRLRDLLAMRDGIAFVEDYVVGHESHVIDMLFGEGKNDVAGFCAQLPLAHARDAFFNYSSGTTNVISRLVADTVGHGDRYRDYLHDQLFGPLGMSSAVATFDATGVFVASSYLHARALDYAKFGLLYLRGGEWDHRQLVSRQWTDTAQIPRSRDEESGYFYSWQWWVSGDRYGTYWASGFEGQMISVVPALDALVLRFGHTPSEDYPALYRWRERVLDVLAR